MLPHLRSCHADRRGSSCNLLAAAQRWRQRWGAAWPRLLLARPPPRPSSSIRATLSTMRWVGWQCGWASWMAVWVTSVWVWVRACVRGGWVGRVCVGGGSLCAAPRSLCSAPPTSFFCALPSCRRRSQPCTHGDSNNKVPWLPAADCGRGGCQAGGGAELLHPGGFWACACRRGCRSGSMGGCGDALPDTRRSRLPGLMNCQARLRLSGCPPPCPATPTCALVRR